jgi:hypothetical protein
MPTVVIFVGEVDQLLWRTWAGGWHFAARSGAVSEPGWGLGLAVLVAREGIDAAAEDFGGFTLVERELLAHGGDESRVDDGRVEPSLVSDKAQPKNHSR